MLKNYYSITLSVCLLLIFTTLIMTIVNYFLVLFSPLALFFFLFWDLLAIIFLILTYKSPRIGFLLSFFSVLVELRILSVNHFYFTVMPVFFAFLLLGILFFYIVYQNIKHFRRSQKFPYGIPIRLSPMEWHLVFVRMYIGYDLIAHCAEKLFAGPIPFQALVKNFTALGITKPDLFVNLAGLAELGGAITLGLGFFTRIGSIMTTIYLMIATILGHHFRLGFIWADPGGGWEYPVMWSALLLSFSLLGDAGKFSIDSVLQEQYSLPRWLKELMGSSILRKD